MSEADVARFKKASQVFVQYIKDKRVLLVDPSKTSRASVANIFVELGCNRNHIAMVANMETAIAELQAKSYHFVVSEFNVGKLSGLDLVPMQKQKLKPDEISFFMLLTSDASQSSVAQAAEEDVDNYLIKPFTAEGLKLKILLTALEKLEPSEYRAKITLGKEKMSAGAFEEAIQLFEEAKALDPKPSLACYYVGQANTLKQLLSDARGDYKDGLEFNKIHYKCLVGLYESFVQEDKVIEAYDVIKRINRYFPANPKRLSNVLRLAIRSNNYDDIERYYKTFVDLETRNQELVRYICAALVVCARFYFQKKVPSRALELLKKAIVTAAQNPKIIFEVIRTAIEFDHLKAAGEFLARFPSGSENTLEFQVLQFLIFDRSAPITASIDEARNLIKKGHRHPIVYEVLVNRCKQEGLLGMANEMMDKAKKDFPGYQFNFLSPKKAA